MPVCFLCRAYVPRYVGIARSGSGASGACMGRRNRGFCLRCDRRNRKTVRRREVHETGGFGFSVLEYEGGSGKGTNVRLGSERGGDTVFMSGTKVTIFLLMERIGYPPDPVPVEGPWMWAAGLQRQSEIGHATSTGTLGGALEGHWREVELLGSITGSVLTCARRRHCCLFRGGNELSKDPFSCGNRSIGYA
jgi:hypothetical protein